MVEADIIISRWPPIHLAALEPPYLHSKPDRAGYGGVIVSVVRGQLQQAQARDDNGFTWVRCPGCGNGLWRDYPGRNMLVMPLGLRGGQKRVISVPRQAVAGVEVDCEKCGATWIGAS